MMINDHITKQHKNQTTVNWALLSNEYRANASGDSDDSGESGPSGEYGPSGESGDSGESGFGLDVVIIV